MIGNGTVVTVFSEFCEAWRPLIRVKSGTELGQDLYFQTERDRKGFDLLPDFFHEHGEEWAVTVARIFEQGSALASRLEPPMLAKFRMIQDRHLVNLAKATFDDDYHRTSDERALFLIYHKVPPVRISSALSRAKNASFDLLFRYQQPRNDAQEVAMMSAMSTMFMAEVHHALRAFVYFERFNSDAAAHFQVVRPCDGSAPQDYSAPTRNPQMSMPDKTKHGSIELF